MELNREQIVKALECCGRIGEHPHNCGGCPLREALDYRRRVYCRAFLAQYALALIRELTEDNKAQAETISSLIETIKCLPVKTVDSNVVVLPKYKYKGLEETNGDV